MRSELLAANKYTVGIELDPRTKLVLVLTMAFFVLGQSGHNTAGWYVHVLAAVPLLMLLSARMWKGTILYLLLYGGSAIAELFLLPSVDGALRFLLVAVCGILMRFVPGIMMGYIMIKTTTVSEFISAMERMRVPDAVTIPMSVMFRFFPTVLEEAQSINRAMRMREIRLAGNRASDMLEYRLVPIIMCSVKIGEELSAAALSRGLGGPVKRTNICKIGFHVQDYLFFALCLGVVLFVFL